MTWRASAWPVVPFDVVLWKLPVPATPETSRSTADVATLTVRTAGLMKHYKQRK